MKTTRRSLAILAACLLSEGTAASPQKVSRHLVLPAQSTIIDLVTGMVERNGVSGQCLEKVSRAGANTLVVSRAPGDDLSLVTLNGTRRELGSPHEAGARMSTIHATRDGALVWLRHFKTGDKQTELLEDGEIRFVWPAGSGVRLLQANATDFVLLIDAPGQSPRLQKLPRRTVSTPRPEPEILVDFDGCVPGRLRLTDRHVWAQMSCDHDRGSGIYRITLDGGKIGAPLIPSESAEFVTLPGSVETNGRIAVATVSGSEAGLQFYFAVKGLLLAQAGEVRACSSDSAGLQSWNQSNRVRALANLYQKTSVPAFADLAIKSMSLTLAAQDGVHGRADDDIPACSWSSLIYSANEKERLSLMINQAVIANALGAACHDLGDACLAGLESKIIATKSCLATSYETDFDLEVGLYRIREDIDFRFSGAIAPWNWQLSFAALLHDLPDKSLRQRAGSIADLFFKEMTTTPEGSLWRYWPKHYYLEKGLAPKDIRLQRFEDTGHAGISLMALPALRSSLDAELAAALSARMRFLLAFGRQTPRDLDGGGPRGTRWYPAGGWADLAPDAMRKAYAGPVPGAQSADALYAYASLFDPEAEFQLRLDLQLCDDGCVPYRTLYYDSWQYFLDNNPFFVLRESKTPPQSEN
ncbi:hypothetical protein [Roseibium aggregatum]|uniref:hypothetical protein n=1 Tax=Roseibium aggregatum TaxID=187304 RepID=UPI001A8CCDBB|nr:hypothetical protein [Roseibium aggregatum]MBN8184709.1 hypothetical protein [Roseibium aggregatum]